MNSRRVQDAALYLVALIAVFVVVAV